MHRRKMVAIRGALTPALSRWERGTRGSVFCYRPEILRLRFGPEGTLLRMTWGNGGNPAGPHPGPLPLGEGETRGIG
jgi:hypothetical protein